MQEKSKFIWDRKNLMLVVYSCIDIPEAKRSGVNFLYTWLFYCIE